MKTTLAKAAVLLTSFIKANTPVNIMGSPGVGKSDVIKQVAKELDLKVIDFRLSTCDPTDLSGIPFITGNRSAYMPNEAFPLVGDALPLKEDGTPYKGWLLFLDEITNAPMAVQAAAYQLVLDRQVGQNNLHPNVRIASAGNLITDAAAVTSEMSTALKSRMAHINIEISVSDWLDWAMGAGVHHSITSFIKFKNTALYAFVPNSSQDTFPCPRTWSMLNDLIQVVGINDPDLQALASATISDGMASEYNSFCKHFSNLPTYADIVANPSKIDIPKEMSTLYALSGSIGSQVKKESIAEVMEFIDRMPKEFQLRTFNDFTKRDTSLVALPPVRAWLVANAKNMVK